MNYYTQKNGKLVCLLCHHYCHLQEGQTGICGVNTNVGDKIACQVYGYLAALNIDPIEKKPLYHFLPASKSLSLGTVGCNFHCAFCQNWGISQEKNIKTGQYLSPNDIVKLALNKGCQSISYTYNEPTIFYPYAKDIALEAKKYNIKSVYVSNGYESREVVEDMKGVIEAVNIDLKTFNEAYYKKLGGELARVLENLKAFVNNGIWVEVTTLVVPSKNDSKEEFEAIASFIKNELGAHVPWHISAFHPDFKERTLPATSFESLKQAYTIGKKVGLNYVYMGNINVENPTVCSVCQEVLLVREGFKVIQNNLQKGLCPKCAKPLEGVFL
ncbi:MAG: AmmeMemoRadiSam system radical SAM enzyme [Candidatus Marinarcus sp.]|uniref:AmmeMemoRadiSam system radical SAM enzyme n=1 Tax=Candidatus Marinarcus sp. TaxID=3100987 RepID=UPI003AFF6520